jgi:hypothetical protein
MKVELRNLKHSAFASQETECFRATVYLDGVRAGVVANGGYGGGHEYGNNTMRERLSEHAKTIPPTPTKWGDIVATADTVIDRALTDAMHRRDLTRLLRSRVLFLKADGNIYQTRVLKPGRIRDALYNRPLGAVAVLNELPFEDALKLYAGAAE